MYAKGRDPHEFAEYVRGLRIPPGYTDVEVCMPGESILYHAKDSNGKAQMRQSAATVEHREQVAKPARIRRLTPDVWARLDKAVDAALRQTTWSTTKLAAAAVLLIQACFFRPGSDTPHQEHFGVVSLQKKHLRSNTGSECHFEFVGKAHQTNRCRVGADTRLCRLLRSLQGKDTHSDARLFSKDGKKLTVKAMRDFLRNATDGRVRPKDIRTYQANLTFLDAMASGESSQRVRALLQEKRRNASWTRDMRKAAGPAIVKTAERLNNTKAVAKSSYILSPVMRAFEEGTVTLAQLDLTPAEMLMELLVPRDPSS